MVHALYLKKDSEENWTSVYRNRYVETETYKLEKERNRPSFLPAVEGDPPAVIASFLLNLVTQTSFELTYILLCMPN